MEQLQILVDFQPADDVDLPIEAIARNRRRMRREFLADMEEMIQRLERTTGELVSYELRVIQIGPQAPTIEDRPQ